MLFRSGVAPIATRVARSRYRAGTCKVNGGSDLRSVFQRAMGRSIAERTTALRSPGDKIPCRCVNSRASSCVKIEASTQRGIRIDRVVFLRGYHQIRVYSVFKSEQFPVNLNRMSQACCHFTSPRWEQAGLRAQRVMYGCARTFRDLSAPRPPFRGSLSDINPAGIGQRDASTSSEYAPATRLLATLS